MEKEILGGKIKELRTVKGYSQEYLADLSQLSLRTIQRIENGETGARGDTLNRLARALDVAIDKLTDLQPATAAPANTDNSNYIILMNLAGLGCLINAIPFLGLIAPLALWLLKKDTVAEVNIEGKKIVNFQITFAMLTVLWYLVVLIIQATHIQFHLPHVSYLGKIELLMLSFISLPLYNSMAVIKNTIRLLMHKKIDYWPAFQFFK